MAILDYTELSVEEKAERNQTLPEQLTIFDIVNLWHNNKRDRKIYCKELFKAFNDGNGLLKGIKEYEVGQHNPRIMYDDGSLFILDLNEIYKNIIITKKDFLDWLKIKDEPLPKDCLLANWWHEYKPQALEEVLGDSEEITELKNKQADKANIKPSTAILTLNKTECLLGSAEDAQVRATADTQLENKNRKSSRKTQINIFLTGICETQEIDKLSAETLVRAIKPLIGTENCPVERYHGCHSEVCINWKTGTGSKSCSWGKKSFQNFVSGFKKEQALKSLSSSNIK